MLSQFLKMTSKFIIKGGRPLKGTVAISGSKNAALPIMCAALLSSEKVVLRNVPRISDTETMRNVLEKLNVKTAWKGKMDSTDGNVLEIDPSGLGFTHITHDLVSKMRASSLLLGPLLARFGKVNLAFPGGCVLGKRSMGAHLDGLKQLGCETVASEKDLKLEGFPKAS